MGRFNKSTLERLQNYRIEKQKYCDTVIRPLTYGNNTPNHQSMNQTPVRVASSRHLPRPILLEFNDSIPSSARSKPSPQVFYSRLKAHIRTLRASFMTKTYVSFRFNLISCDHETSMYTILMYKIPAASKRYTANSHTRHPCHCLVNPRLGSFSKNGPFSFWFSHAPPRGYTVTNHSNDSSDVHNDNTLFCHHDLRTLTQTTFIFLHLAINGHIPDITYKFFHPTEAGDDTKLYPLTS